MIYCLPGHCDLAQGSSLRRVPLAYISGHGNCLARHTEQILLTTAALPEAFTAVSFSRKTRLRLSDEASSSKVLVFGFPGKRYFYFVKSITREGSAALLALLPICGKGRGACLHHVPHRFHGLEMKQHSCCNKAQRIQRIISLLKHHRSWTHVGDARAFR